MVAAHDSKSCPVRGGGSSPLPGTMTEQISKGLPREVVKKVRITENNEPLVEIVETDRVKLLKEHRFLSPYVRKSVLDLIYQGANNLPHGYQLLVVTALRPKRMQEKLWKQRVWQMTKKQPFLRLFRPKEFERKVSLYTAPPGGSPHQCGSAIDVTVIKPDGERLDMGTNLTGFGPKAHMHSDLISNEAKENRALLRNAMTKVGFVYYPLEWWHYSYGDQMWAAYQDKNECFYGPVTE